MTLGGVGADVVGVVVEAELASQGVDVGGDLLAELGQRRVAVALGHVAVDLVVGPVLLDQQEHVLDGRRVTDALGNGDGAWSGLPVPCLTSVSAAPQPFWAKTLGV